jgi:hypothetical protein
MRRLRGSVSLKTGERRRKPARCYAPRGPSATGWSPGEELEFWKLGGSLLHGCSNGLKVALDRDPEGELESRL